MPKRKYHTDPARLLAEGQKIVQTTEDAKYRHRVEIVNLVLGGQIPSQQPVCERKQNTITRWAKITDEQGFESLRPQKTAGRPSRLNTAQRNAIKSVLEEDNPKAQGHEVWDGKAYQTILKKPTPST